MTGTMDDTAGGTIVDVITVRYQFTREEWARAIRALTFATPRSWIVLPAFILVTVVGVVSLATGDAHRGVPVTVVGVLMVALLLRRLYWPSRRSFDHNPAISQAWETTFTPEGVSLKGEHASAQSAWQAYRGATERGDFLLLRTIAGRANIVPIGSLSAAERAALRSWYQAAFAAGGQ